MSQLMRVEAVAAAIGVSRRTLERMVNDGRFIAPIRLTAGTIGWDRETLDRYLKERQACAQQ